MTKTVEMWAVFDETGQICTNSLALDRRGSIYIWARNYKPWLAYYKQGYRVRKVKISWEAAK